MAGDGNPTRVVAICEPGPTQEQITTALSSQPEFLLADVLVTSDKLAREIRAADPEIILVDHQILGQPTLDLLDDLAIQFPEVSLIAILPGEDPLRAQQVMLAGARGFIVQPFTQINLLSTLRRVRDLEVRRQLSRTAAPAGTEEPVRPLRSLTVFSPRGGVGTSTVATNLALALREETEKQILLFEGKLFFGHLDVMLNIRSQNTLADLIPHANNLDDSLIADCISKHASGLHVLLSPSNFQVAQGIRPDDLYNVFMSVQRLYDFIVVDGGSALTENTVTLMDASDRVLLVANPDLASLRDVSRFIQMSRSLAYPLEKLLVVLNRSNQPGGVRSKDIEAVLHHQLFSQIPDDSQNTLRSLNRGIPLYVRYTRSPIAKAIKSLAKSLLDLSVMDAKGAAAGVDRAGREALMASSQMG